MMAYDGYMQKVVPFIESHRVNNIFVDSYLGTKLELKELGRIIQPYEEILYITGCKMHSNAGKKVLVCVTDSRLLILNKGWIGNRYQHSVFLDRISSTQRGRGLVFGSVNVNMMGNEEPFSLYGFWLKDTEQFVFHRVIMVTLVGMVMVMITIIMDIILIKVIMVIIKGIMKNRFMRNLMKNLTRRLTKNLM